ncbi:MAG: dihydrolipoamide acetyltransferase family protein [Ktedonobacteraceae bacterium]|nr:2-oxo acid dehydrogenase subunit E2 [Chloroflexota bacterium]
MKTVEMPKMGDTMEQGKILRWLKQEGDSIKKGDFLAEIETEKVNIEVEAFASGILRKILVPEGESADVGAGIALIGKADEPLPGHTNGAHNAPTVPAADPVASAGQALTATSSPLAIALQDPPSLAAVSATVTSAAERERIFISPVARRLAEEHQLDYTRVSGTGPNGRIIRMDVEAALAQRPTAITAPATQAAPSAQPDMPPGTSSEVGEVLEIPLTAMRRTIARRLAQSMQTAPHFYVSSVIDTVKLAALRQEINAYAAGAPEPVKISFNDLIVRAVAQALVRMPQMNVSFAEDRLLQKKRVHVGIAVALEEGLIVPVLRDADRRGVLDIARASRKLAEAARTGKLRPEDFSGGTFTISNLGMFDVDSFTAVINPPESAILAIGSITPTPAVVDGQVVVRDRMKVTLSSDHRAIDGATAARFLQLLKRMLEEPLGMLL